jgi:hypothetical protein
MIYREGLFRKSMTKTILWKKRYCLGNRKKPVVRTEEKTLNGRYKVCVGIEALNVHVATLITPLLKHGCIQTEKSLNFQSLCLCFKQANVYAKPATNLAIPKSKMIFCAEIALFFTYGYVLWVFKIFCVGLIIIKSARIEDIQPDYSIRPLPSKLARNDTSVTTEH